MKSVEVLCQPIKIPCYAQHEIAFFIKEIDELGHHLLGYLEVIDEGFGELGAVRNGIDAVIPCEDIVFGDFCFGRWIQGGCQDGKSHLLEFFGAHEGRFLWLYGRSIDELMMFFCFGGRVCCWMKSQFFGS